MIKLLAISITLIALQGCAPTHYVTVRADAVALHLRAPKAASVQFASSMDQFTLHQTRRDKDGSWVITGLQNKEFQYFYLVDGKVVIPDCRFKENDMHKRILVSCILVLLLAGTVSGQAQEENRTAMVAAAPVEETVAVVAVVIESSACLRWRRAL